MRVIAESNGPTLRAWQQLGRQVRKGERGIAILIDQRPDGSVEIVLQARAFDRGQEPHLDLMTPMSIVRK